jgi:succinate-semialdehyde dehydrogenase/glutarate-semialdehyde dehydrogenase
MEILISRNPRNGTVLKEIPKSPVHDLPAVFDQAARAQALWSKLTVKQRAKKLLQLREVLCRRVDDVAKVIHEENGKPHVEAYICEILPAIELLTYFAGIAPSRL